MKHAIIGYLAALAACMNQPAPAPEPAADEAIAARTEAAAADWQCGGDKFYFKWVCDTMIGQWSKVYVGVESWGCGYPPTHVLDGVRTTCHEAAMYTCGGGPNDLCNDDDTCSFPPPTACRRKPVDPPPCCLE